MTNTDLIAERGFTIGDHASSRSLFGLRRSQIVGEVIGIICSFSALLVIGSSAGLVTFVVIGVLVSLGFLVGYRRRTLDVVLGAAVCFLKDGSHQKSQRYRHDPFGFATLPGRSSYLASRHSYGSVRISNTRQRHPTGHKVRTSGLEISHPGEVCLDDGTFLGIAKERSSRRGVVAFEVFGNDFLYRDQADQFVRASAFGSMLGSVSSLSNMVESLVLLYTIDPNSGEELRACPDEWPDELRSLYLQVKEKAVTRRSFIIIRAVSTKLVGNGYQELVSFISGLGLRFRALDANSLADLFAFGSGERAFNGVLHMRSEWSHLLIGERAMKVFDIAELPAGEVQPDFLVPFVTTLATQSLLTFELKAIDSRFAMKKVRSRRSGITADAGVRALLGFLARNSEARAITSLEVQENDLDMGYEMFSVTGHFAIFADDLAGLKAATLDATAKAEKSGMVLECAYGRQLQVRHRLFGSAM